jgi:hypothetical protein
LFNDNLAFIDGFPELLSFKETQEKGRRSLSPWSVKNQMKTAEGFMGGNIWTARAGSFVLLGTGTL